MFSSSLNSINVLIILTDLIINTKFFILTLIILKYCAQKTISKKWFLFSFFNPSIVINYSIPLSNSLFLIHPILLLMAISSSIHNFFLGRFYKNLILINFIYMLAIFFGGLWAQQEFSWGGWWNWDFVELGIFLTWCMWLHATHLYLHLRLLMTMFTKFICFIFVCACLNKWGITISVHRFIQSSFFNNFFYFYLVVVCFFGLNFLKKLPLIGVVMALTSLFYLFKELMFLKLIVIFSVIWVRVKTGSLMQRFWHKLLICILLLFILFNFFNFNFFLSLNSFTYVMLFFYDEVFRITINSWFSSIVFLSIQDIFFFKVLNILYPYELLISFFYQPLKMFVYYF